ncbi:MAG: PAS domain S-box protein [Desulfobacteraceae bacterium]|jgi:PAS domain S-box-containing protein
MKISIRWAFILGFLVIIWGAQIITTSYTYLSSQRVLRDHARDIMQNISDLTMEQSHNHLELAQDAAHLTQRLISSNVVGSDLDHRSILEKYFLDQLAIYPHFAGIYVGLPNGDFLYVSRSDLRLKNGFRTKIISHHNGRKKTSLQWRDQKLKVVDEATDPKDTYDPRARPWYKMALRNRAIVWTDPYIFFTSQKPGITIAAPIYRDDNQLQAVVGVDIEIDQLSTFIGKLRIGKNGRAFMFNNNRDVVAFPDASKMSLRDADQIGNARLVKIDELGDGLSRAAYDAVQWPVDPNGRLALQEPHFTRFEYGGEVYHAMFTPLENRQWPWIIGVYFPESDYLGTIQDNRRFNIWLTMGISAMATIIGLLLARAITRPLAGLEQEAQAIQQNDLTRQLDTGSAFKEIQEMSDSFALMKEDIRVGEEKYRGIFDNMQDVYYEATYDGQILEISPSIEKVSSYTRSELIGANLERVFQNSQDREQMLAALTNDGKVSDYGITMTNKDGATEHCAINAAVKLGTDGEPEKVVGSLRVVTLRKKEEIELRLYQEQLEELVRERTQDLERSNRQLRAQVEARKEKEAALLESEEKYRSIIENMENGYYEFDLDGNFTFFNDTMARMLGYDADELMGLNCRVYMDPATAQSVIDKYEAIRLTGRSLKLSRYTILRKDGSRRTIEWTAELRTDQNGDAIGYRGVVLDISEKLEVEEEKQRLEGRLHQIQRLEGIGTLAGGVAHDFNNLLMGIQGNVSLLLMDMSPDDPDYAKLKGIESCVQGGSDLTRQLLGFARGGKYMVKAINFNQIIRSTAQMFGRTRKEISIHENLMSDLWTVLADQNQIEQVLLNLYINAWQAMPNGGHLYLESKNIVLDAPFARIFDIEPGSYVRISVEDTGFGIEKATQHKIFEPFFTTKEIGRGTGMGLASAYGIINNHGGAIDFTSTVGKGTAFYLYLPATDVVVEEKTAATVALAKGSETILIVDDEDVVLDVNKPMLESLGYTVLTASGGREAIKIFDADYRRIDMVILDMIMPELGGGVVFDHFKETNPDVKVLLSTGYSITGQAEEILARGCAGFIQKPFNISLLSKKIRQVLERDDELRSA